MPIRVTADANTLVSGAVRTRPDAAPVRFLDTWRTVQFALILSEHLLNEVATTLAKPYFMARLRLPEREAFLIQLRTDAIFTPLTASVIGIASHPEDDLVLATAVSGDAQFLVTGDYRLLALKQYADVAIVGVQAFLALLPGMLDGEPESEAGR